MTEKILVTGAAGFVGSHLVDRLIHLGKDVVGIDNFDGFYERRLKEQNLKSAYASANFTLFEGDIRDPELLSRVFRSAEIYTVVHLAAKAGVRPSMANPRAYCSVNVNGTVELLEAMRSYGANKLVFASSSSVYGNNRRLPFCENAIVDEPISPYAATKRAGELLCHTYHHLYGFHVFALRLFTVYGPRQRPDLAIHKFTNMIINGQPINIYGDGSSSRDYTYVDDIIDGIQAAIARLNGFEIINLGRSDPVRLEDMISALETAIGKKAVRRYSSMQPGDVDITFADVAKAASILGYSPKTVFQKGISEFINWKLEIENPIHFERQLKEF